MTWILSNTSDFDNLVQIARTIDSPITVVTVGDAQIRGVDRVIRIPSPAVAEAAVPAVLYAIDEPDLVLAVNAPAERAYAGAVAAKFALPVLTSFKNIDGGHVKLSRFGGLSNEIVTLEPAVAIIDGGGVVEGELSPEIAGDSTFFDVQVTDVTIQSETAENLLGADLVGAGRGFAHKEDLNLARHLANALDGVLGCSRPLAEGMHWMSRDTYIGVSGQVIKPALYIAVGISGQIHHTAGVMDADTIVAINDDELAAIFDYADYGIVGDLYDILPQLTEALS